MFKVGWVGSFGVASVPAAERFGAVSSDGAPADGNTPGARPSEENWNGAGAVPVFIPPLGTLATGPTPGIERFPGTGRFGGGVMV